MRVTRSARRPVLEFLGDACLFDPQTFYGQNALKATLLRRTAHEYDWHFIGTSSRCYIDASHANYHHVPVHDLQRYLRSLIGSLRPPTRVPAFASFVVQSTDALNALVASPDLTDRIALHVILHCTAEELLPDLFGGGQTPHSVARTLRAVAPVASQFIYVSDAVRRSFARDEVVRFFGDDVAVLERSATIPNAVDTAWLGATRRRYGVLKPSQDHFVIGSMAGFKPYKGRDIMVALLRATQATGPTHWRFALAALPNYGTRDLLRYLCDEFAELVDSRRVALFADVSQWADVSPQIAHHTTAAIEDFRSNLPADLRRCFDSCFVGVLTEPAQAQFDVQIRPSLHEGFGRAVIESLVLGVPVLASDRGSLAGLLPAETTISFPESVTLAAALQKPRISAYEDACASLGRAFHSRLVSLEMTRAMPDAHALASHLDVDRMVTAYREVIDAA